MIVTRQGDIFKALKKGEIDSIAHGCNCSNGFGSGMAAQVAKQYPEVKKEYHEAYAKDLCKLGWVQLVPVDDGMFMNCMTQQKYGGAGNDACYIDYEAIRTCMKALYVHAQHSKIGIPKIGAGLGGGNWNLIKGIISSVFHDDTELYLYLYD